jgi:D-serine deaminase-like pyridoxal phosphate-dependent protein
LNPRAPHAIARRRPGAAGATTAVRDYQYYRELLRGRRLPLAFVDLDAFDANAARLVARAGGKPVRVASKSLRCRALLERVLGRRGFEGIMCYSAAEAAHLARHGLDDLLVGYPTVEPADVVAAARAVADGRRIVFTIDAEEQVSLLGRVAREHGIVLPVCIDLDVSSRWPGLHFGARRSPLRDARAVLALARAVERTPGLAVEGLLGYEAQIAGVPDHAPGRPLLNPVVRLLQRRSRGEVASRRGAAAAALGGAGFRLRFVNGGGTGSLESTAADPSVTEVTAGSGLFCPALFDGYRNVCGDAAAAFAIPITRAPAPGIYTCHGGGYAASGAAGKDRLPSPWLPAGARLLAAEGAGEVQTPVAYAGPLALRIGDPVLLRHAKAGELCERFDRLLLVSNGAVAGEVPTYRGEGLAFL